MEEQSLKTASQLAEDRANFREKQSYNRKIITSGDTVEVYSLKTRQRKGYEKKDTGQKRRNFSDLSFEEKVEAYKRKTVYIKQKRVDVMRLISSNFQQGLTKFLTLTFKEHVTDRAQAMDEFKNFMKRLNYLQKKLKRQSVKYLGVIEYTKKGRIHFHVVLFNCGYIPKAELEKIWGNGFVRINRIKGMNGSAVARY
uniref:rolling circle replication-associated protein n=1 Tax=Streptococcus pluranimalium TaxID=82348 RepID=UPI003F693E1F